MSNVFLRFWKKFLLNLHIYIINLLHIALVLRVPKWRGRRGYVHVIIWFN